MKEIRGPKNLIETKTICVHRPRSRCRQARLRLSYVRKAFGDDSSSMSAAYHRSAIAVLSRSRSSGIAPGVIPSRPCSARAQHQNRPCCVSFKERLLGRKELIQAFVSERLSTATRPITAWKRTLPARTGMRRARRAGILESGVETRSANRSLERRSLFPAIFLNPPRSNICGSTDDPPASSASLWPNMGWDGTTDIRG